MGPDAYQLARKIPKVVHDISRHTQLRRCTTPEQITWRGSYNGKIGFESANSRPNVVDRQILELSIYSLDCVARPFKQRAGIAELKRKMRLAATEVDTAVEIPTRVNEREPHGGLLFRTEMR
jgi:hypothetical protein